MNNVKKAFLPYTNLDNLTSDIVELARNILPNKVIYINFLNNDIQLTLKVSQNDTKVSVNEGEFIPVINALCNNIDFKAGKPLVLKDTSNHPFDDLVAETIKKGNIGSYLGIPIRFQNGERFGALCAAHHDESEFNETDIILLEKIANLFSYYLELEHQVYIDTLTGIENSRYLGLKEDEIITSGGLSLMLDLDNFKSVNDTHGHHVGDLVLQELAHDIKKVTSEFTNKITVRVGGDEFYIFIHDLKEIERINDFLTKLLRTLREWTTDIDKINLSSSVGALLFTKDDYRDFNDLYQETDALLYEAKAKGKDTFVFKTR